MEPNLMLAFAGTSMKRTTIQSFTRWVKGKRHNSGKKTKALSQ